MLDTKKKHNFRELIIGAIIRAIIVTVIASLVVLIGFVYDTYLTPNAGEMTYESCEQEIEGLYKDAIQEIPQEVEPGGPSRQEIDKTRKEAKQKNLENTVLCNDLAAQQAMSDRANWGLFVGGLGLIVLGITLWQTGKAARAASSTLVQTGKAARAASSTLEVARFATKAEFQPYISVEPDDIKIFVSNGSKGSHHHTLSFYTDIYEIENIDLAENFEIKNIGKTPAFNVEATGTGKFYKDGQEFKAPVTVYGLKKGDFVPGQIWSFAWEVTFESPEGKADHFADITEVDIYISVIFTDMFSDEKPRKYKLHYLCNRSTRRANLQSITEKTQKQGLRS